MTTAQASATNTFWQHIPAYVDGDRPGPVTFSTTQELLALPVVQRYGKGADFSHFAMSDNALMEIADDGFYWWVVGHVADPTSIDLPKWNGGKYRAQLADGTKTVLSSEVTSSCGDELRLRDGSKATWLREA
jgi:hypothetical protein